jgi:hypothetical protein
MVRINGTVFKIGNYDQYRDTLNNATAGVFKYIPDDQYAYFVPMSEIEAALNKE